MKIRHGSLAVLIVFAAAASTGCGHDAAAEKTAHQIQELQSLIEAQQKQIGELSDKIERLNPQLTAATKTIGEHANKIDKLDQRLTAATKPKPRNIVVNGDFETPAVSGGFVMYQPGRDMGGWLVAKNAVDLMAPSAAAPAKGKQSVDLSGSKAGEISQDLETEPGQVYELRFAMAGTGVVEQMAPTVKRMEVHWGEKLVDTPSFDITEHTIKEMGWEYHTYRVTATDSKTCLRFTSLSDSQWGPALDEVSVIPVVP
jgi:choice-of-anchor C domain-containing protein